MMELSRIITAVGAVVASTGLILYGIGASYVQPNDFETTATLWMMIIGLVATAIGLVMYRRAYQEED
ncbi:MAG TPA: hypothetical protein VD789_02195 [Thermomicrobiales bacterium]|nr:hypothetical protein [Thermomicrobiales bacterium]